MTGGEDLRIREKQMSTTDTVTDEGKSQSPNAAKLLSNIVFACTSINYLHKIRNKILVQSASKATATSCSQQIIPCLTVYSSFSPRRKSNSPIDETSVHQNNQTGPSRRSLESLHQTGKCGSGSGTARRVLHVTRIDLRDRSWADACGIQ